MGAKNNGSFPNSRLPIFTIIGLKSSRKDMKSPQHQISAVLPQLYGGLLTL
jgi:hypothetical protein